MYTSFSKYFNFQNHSESMNFFFNETLFVDRPCLLNLRPERLPRRRRRRQENQWLNRQKMQIRKTLLSSEIFVMVHSGQTQEVGHLCEENGYLIQNRIYTSENG